MYLNKKLINKDLLNREYAWFGRYKNFDFTVKYIIEDSHFFLVIKNAGEVLFEDSFPTVHFAQIGADSWIQKYKCER